MGPNVRMSATSAAPVASVLARRAMATFPPDSLSPIMPEPMTVARRKAVPVASEAVPTENPIRLLDACTYKIFTLILLTDFRIWISRSRFSFMALFPLLLFLAGSFFAPRLELMAEILALRQQLAILNRTAKRPSLRFQDRLFLIALARFWRDWRSALLIVKQETVIKWHRQGFRLYWRWKSKAGLPGRPRIDAEIRELIRRLSQENPLWGTPRILAELHLLGFEVAESTVAKYRINIPKPSSQTWKTFRSNHAGDIIGIDFFTVPTATFRNLYCFIILLHERRRVVHFNVTDHPTAAWTAQANDRGVSGRLCSRLPAPRPGFDLRTRFSAAGSWNADRRGDHRPTFALAKSIRRTPDRQYSPRVSRPRDCTFRRASSKNSKEVLSLLPEFQATSITRSELSHTANRRIWKERPGYLNRRGRWPTSPVSTGSLKKARLSCSRLRTDNKSIRNKLRGPIKM